MHTKLMTFGYHPAQADNSSRECRYFGIQPELSGKRWLGVRIGQTQPGKNQERESD